MEITISEAISLLSASAEGSTTHDEKFKAALKLGAEGLKRLRYLRTISKSLTLRQLLPREAVGKP